MESLLELTTNGFHIVGGKQSASISEYEQKSRAPSSGPRPVNTSVRGPSQWWCQGEPFTISRTPRPKIEETWLFSFGIVTWALTTQLNHFSPLCKVFCDWASEQQQVAYLTTYSYSHFLLRVYLSISLMSTCARAVRLLSNILELDGILTTTKDFQHSEAKTFLRSLLGAVFVGATFCSYHCAKGSWHLLVSQRWVQIRKKMEHTAIILKSMSIRTEI